MIGPGGGHMQDPGVLVRALHDVFAICARDYDGRRAAVRAPDGATTTVTTSTAKINVSYIEVYNEHIREHVSCPIP